MKKRAVALMMTLLLAALAAFALADSEGVIVGSSCNIVQSGEYYLVYCYAQVHNNSSEIICLESGSFELHSGEQILASQPVTQLWPYFINPGEDGYVFDVVAFEPGESGAVVPSVTDILYDIQYMTVDPKYASRDLSAMAELIAGQEEDDLDSVLRIMNTFSLDKTFVSTVALLRPDGTLLLTDGARYDVSGAFDFETEAARGEYISDRVTSYFAPEKLVVRNVAPVKRDGETIAILYGMVPLQELSRSYKTDLYGGNAFVLIVDGNTGDILMDT